MPSSWNCFSRTGSLMRSERLVSRRVKSACFRQAQNARPVRFGLSNPAIKKKQIFDLASGRFIRERRDVLWLQDHPAWAKAIWCRRLGYQAIKGGFVVLYRSIARPRWFATSCTTKPTAQNDKILAGYLKPDLLIIDDMGMKQLPKRSGEISFRDHHARHEKRSTMMTSTAPGRLGAN